MKQDYIFDLYSVSVSCTETYLLIQDNLDSTEYRMLANSKQIIVLVFIGQLNIKNSSISQVIVSTTVLFINLVNIALHMGNTYT